MNPFINYIHHIDKQSLFTNHQKKDWNFYQLSFDKLIRYTDRTGQVVFTGNDMQLFKTIEKENNFMGG